MSENEAKNDDLKQKIAEIIESTCEGNYDHDVTNVTDAAEKIAALWPCSAASSVESEGLQLGDVTEFRPDAPHASEWRGVELTIVSLRADPDGNQWVSAIERQERHRGWGQYDGETTDIDASHLRLIRRKAAPLNAPAGNVWQPISTAPKADKDSTQAISFIGWCPDDTAPGGGDQRVVWWEPRMKKGAGCWWGDRDLEETPTHWKQLGEPPALSATEQR